MKNNWENVELLANLLVVGYAADQLLATSVADASLESFSSLEVHVVAEDRRSRAFGPVDWRRSVTILRRAVARFARLQTRFARSLRKLMGLGKVLDARASRLCYMVVSKYPRAQFYSRGYLHVGHQFALSGEWVHFVGKLLSCAQISIFSHGLKR